MTHKYIMFCPDRTFKGRPKKTGIIIVIEYDGEITKEQIPQDCTLIDEAEG